MALLTGLTANGTEVPVQVKPDGALVAEHTDEDLLRLRSPDGTLWLVTVDDAGVLATTVVPVVTANRPSPDIR